MDNVHITNNILLKVAFHRLLSLGLGILFLTWTMNTKYDFPVPESFLGSSLGMLT